MGSSPLKSKVEGSMGKLKEGLRDFLDWGQDHEMIWLRQFNQPGQMFCGWEPHPYWKTEMKLP